MKKTKSTTKLKSNWQTIIWSSIFVAVMLVFYYGNKSKDLKTAKIISDMQSKQAMQDSSIKVFLTKLADKNKYLDCLEDSIKQLRYCSKIKQHEISSLKKTVNVYVKIKSDADSVELNRFARLQSELEARQRNRKELEKDKL